MVLEPSKRQEEGLRMNGGRRQFEIADKLDFDVCNVALLKYIIALIVN